MLNLSGFTGNDEISQRINTSSGRSELKLLTSQFWFYIKTLFLCATESNYSKQLILNNLHSASMQPFIQGRLQITDLALIKTQKRKVCPSALLRY